MRKRIRDRERRHPTDRRFGGGRIPMRAGPGGAPLRDACRARMRHKSRVRIACIAAVAAALAGCGSDKSESLPAACTEGPDVVVRALAKAPAPVTIDGTPISECFNRDATSDDVQIVGTNLLGAAQQLVDRNQALQLGYLIGAARRGAKRNGLGDEIVRRLEAEATVDAAQRANYDRGLRAGAATG